MHTGATGRVDWGIRLMGQNSYSYETTVRLNYHPKDQPIRMQSFVTLKKVCVLSYEFTTSNLWNTYHQYLWN